MVASLVLLTLVGKGRRSRNPILPKRTGWSSKNQPWLNAALSQSGAVGESLNTTPLKGHLESQSNTNALFS